MATKQINAVEIHIRIPIPVTYPLEATAHVEWEVQGLPEASTGHKIITGSIPAGTTTIGAILSNLKAQLGTLLQNDGAGGHTIVDKNP